ncbi:MAG TPA: phytoene/squalene synthase family protein [Pseudoxanthomonas sp.]
MTDSTALDGFLDKWRKRWPEWAVVEVFVPASQRRLAVAWFALQQEFVDAMNIAGDPLPGDAKLAWWGEELRDWSRQRSRHPLGRVLEPQRAPWGVLADALPVVALMREQPVNAETAFTTSRALASAIIEVESALFGHPPDEAQVQAVGAQLLAARLEEAGTAAVPATAPDCQSGPLESAWTTELLQRWPERIDGAVPCRLWSALARSRLQRFRAAGEGIAPLSPARALWLGWRAARRR